MSKKVQRIPYHLDAGGIKRLPREEITAILRGADDLIGSGGRTLLAKLLKGSKDKKILELGLEENPSYGFYGHLSLEEVQARIDWAILQGYLKIEYDYRLPLLYYTRLGWEIERETYATELLRELDDMLLDGESHHDMTFLKDKSRDMILLLLDKVASTRDPKYIPLLEDWEAIDYKKVRARIREVIDQLENGKAGQAG